MKYLISLICTLTVAVLLCATASAQTITLTPEQVESVCQDVIEPEPTPPTPPTPTPEPTPEPSQCQSGSGGQVVSWQSVFKWSFPLPRSTNIRNYRMPRGQFVAVQFRTGSVVDNGKITLLEGYTSGIREGSISKCPGDFSPAAPCSYTWGLGGGIRWATDGKFGACQLEPSTTYYFNVRFKARDCKSMTCYLNLQHVNL